MTSPTWSTMALSVMRLVCVEFVLTVQALLLRAASILGAIAEHLLRSERTTRDLYLRNNLRPPSSASADRGRLYIFPTQNPGA